MFGLCGEAAISFKATTYSSYIQACIIWTFEGYLTFKIEFCRLFYFLGPYCLNVNLNVFVIWKVSLLIPFYFDTLFLTKSVIFFIKQLWLLTDILSWLRKKSIFWVKCESIYKIKVLERHFISVWSVNSTA